MAQQRRMIYAQLAENKEFASMSDKAQKTYIFLIVLADDDGRLKGDSEWLRIKIFPYDTRMTQMHMKSYLKEIHKAHLITWYKVEENYFIEHPNWSKFQILRADRKKDSDIPPSTDNQLTTKGRVSKLSKLSKSIEEKPEASLSYLKNIPINHLFEFYQRFDCSKNALISKGEDLFNYCKTTGKTYKDYHFFMLKSVKKDFPERKKDDKIRTSKLIEVEGMMKILPKELQDLSGSVAEKIQVE